MPYYKAADTIISEASSTVFDFLALGKTGIVYDLPCENLIHSDGQPLLEIDNREFLNPAFVHIDNPLKIGEAVERALNPTAERQKTRTGKGTDFSISLTAWQQKNDGQGY